MISNCDSEIRFDEGVKNIELNIIATVWQIVTNNLKFYSVVFPRTQHFTDGNKNQIYGLVFLSHHLSRLGPNIFFIFLSFNILPSG